MGNMTEENKIVMGKYGASTAPQIISTHSTVTRGNQLRLEKARCKYNLCKYYFTNLLKNSHRGILPVFVIYVYV